jgi:PAS domain S-box-containing protein
MATTQRDVLRDLLRRIDEIRGYTDPADRHVPIDPDAPDAMVETVGLLVEELERSHRRLIETNVQLVSLREVASHMVTATDAGETARAVARYLSHAFGFDEVFLLLLDREARTLDGAWVSRRGDRENAAALTVPLLGDAGALGRALWLNRTVAHHAPRPQLVAPLPEGHPLEDVVDRLGSLVVVPLQRSQTLVPTDDTHELCGARCLMGDASVLAPPPGPAAQRWAADREERQRHCLGCELMPMLGVLGAARRRDAPPLTPADVTLLESIALSIAPMVENARLYQDLRRSERFREHVLDSMASALVAVNMRGEVLTFNHAAADLLGWAGEEAPGQPVGTILGSDGDALVRDTLEHGREVLRENTMLRARDGTPVPVSFTTSLLRNERRAVYGAIATFVDLTPLRRAEEHARRLDRLAALGRFTSSVAHEIRNPLAGIGAGVQYLAQALRDDDRQRENLAFILGEIQRLDRIVQDLFEITHPRGLAPRVAPVEDTLGRAVQCLRALAEERGVELDVRVTPRTPAVSHDADQIEQVFINLVKNALEASPAGGRVTLSVGPASPGPARRGRRVAAPAAVAVQVEDQGSGIAADDLRTIFEPFFTTKPGGTGLGLYITHDIIKRHGGSLTVQSEPGRGTTFTVELPMEPNGGNP